MSEIVTEAELKKLESQHAHSWMGGVIGRLARQVRASKADAQAAKLLKEEAQKELRELQDRVQAMGFVVEAAAAHFQGHPLKHVCDNLGEIEAALENLDPALVGKMKITIGTEEEKPNA